MKRNKKSVTILFSSGVDSTYLLQKNLEEGNNVELLQNIIINNLDKSYVEYKASKEIIDYYNKKYNVNLYLSTDIQLKISNTKSNMPQPVIWIFSAAMSYHRNDEIQIGYIMNDDAISFLPDIKKLYKSYEAFNGKLPKLTFPLIKHNKEEILHKIDKEALKLTVTCEKPRVLGKLEQIHALHTFIDSSLDFKYEECGTCLTCKKRQFYIKEYNLEDLFNINKNINNFNELGINNTKNLDIISPYLEPELKSL